ncbi:MAG: RpiB/LacA/LacB family sugar-phosphate isomerase [bacterium]|nr:RpiB/LacA/LacB family sugar-phosphate isomerase [bacterium]
MNIYLASDHAGFELKNYLAEYIKNLGFTVIDKGPFSMDPGDDYPDYIRLVAEEILKNPDSSRGVILGSSGQGEAMAANRFKGIRAAVYYGPPCPRDGEAGGEIKIIELSRQHNNANILSLGAHFLTNTEAEQAVKLWFETPFSNDERHVRRLSKLDI